jgi:hypothetical protein
MPDEIRIERRAHSRIAVQLSASLRGRGQTGAPVRVVDLSIDGCRVEANGALVPGSWVWLNLPGLESLYAQIIWWHDCYGGLEFDPPLHPTVLNRLADPAPVLSEVELAQLRSVAVRCHLLASRGLDETARSELSRLAARCEETLSPLR